MLLSKIPLCLCLMAAMMAAMASPGGPSESDHDIGRAHAPDRLSNLESFESIMEYLDPDSMLALYGTSQFYRQFFNQQCPRFHHLRRLGELLRNRQVSLTGSRHYIENLRQFLEPVTTEKKHVVSFMLKGARAMHLVSCLFNMQYSHDAVLSFARLLLSEYQVRDVAEFSFGWIVDYCSQAWKPFPELDSIPGQVFKEQLQLLIPHYKPNSPITLPEPILRTLQQHATDDAPGFRLLLPEPFRSLLSDAGSSDIAMQHSELIRGNAGLLADLMRGGIMVRASHLNWSGITASDWLRMCAFIRFDLNMNDFLALLQAGRSDLIAAFLSECISALNFEIGFYSALTCQNWGAILPWTLYRNPSDSSSLLHYAVQKDKRDLLRVLWFIPGMDREARDASGKTPADYVPEGSDIHLLMPNMTFAELNM